MGGTGWQSQTKKPDAVLPQPVNRMALTISFPLGEKNTRARIIDATLDIEAKK